MNVVGSLLLIVVIVILGASSRRFNVYTKDETKTISSFVYYFALPSLFLVKIAEINFFEYDFRIIIGAVLPVFIIIAMLFAAHYFNRLSKEIFILLGLSVSFGSNSFFGIPFFHSLYGEEGLDFAVVTGAVFGITGILISLSLFEYATSSRKGLKLLNKIMLNPLVISIIAGFIFSLLRIHFTILFSSLSAVGKTAGPIALFSLGMFLYDNLNIQTIKKSMGYAVFRFFVLPIITFTIVFLLLNLSDPTRTMLFLQAGIPSAISLTVFAQKHNYKTTEITGIVIITSIMSVFMLPLLYLIAKAI